MIRTALQSAVVGMITSVIALWVRFGAQWWPASPLEKAAYTVMCPACPVDIAARRLPANDAVSFVLLCAVIYALAGLGIEAARRMRRGENQMQN